MPTYPPVAGGPHASRSASTVDAIASCRVRARRAVAPNASNSAPWSAISCRIPRGPFAERRAALTSLPNAITGEPLTKASPKAAMTFATPGPLVSSAAPTWPVARCSPSAA